jgi:hypothetical protein
LTVLLFHAKVGPVIILVFYNYFLPTGGFMDQQTAAVASPRPERKQSDVEKRLFDIGTSKKFQDWGPLMARAWHNLRGIPSSVLYDLVQQCPEKFDGVDRDLRAELIQEYRKEILETTPVSSIAERGRKFTTLLQLANFAGRTYYLKERAFTRLAFKESRAAMPKEVTERIATCDAWNAKNGRYSKEDLLGANYVLKESDEHREIYVHPLSRESISVYMRDLLSPEDKAHVKAIKDGQRRARQLERSKNPNRGVSGVKKTESAIDKKSPKKKK